MRASISPLRKAKDAGERDTAQAAASLEDFQASKSGEVRGMKTKILVSDPLKCTGCKDCEVACSVRHTGVRKTPRTRIHIIGGARGGFYLPTTCQQCVNPPCMAVCPNRAIYRDKDLDRVMVREELCVGCKMCVSACPTGAMGLDPELGRAYKCDLCDGDPQCVRVCDAKALDYTEPVNLQAPRMRRSANLLYGVLRGQVA